MNIEVTGVKIFKAKKRGAIIGYANVIIGNGFIIRGITILDTKTKGRFLRMPTRRLRNNDNKSYYRDLCHPLNQEVRDELTKKVLEAYDEQTEK